MGEGSNVRFSVIGVLFLLLALRRSLASGDEHIHPRWRKAMPFGETSSSSSMIQVLNRAGSSSIVFPLHGNVYPTGFYNVTLNIGQPSKPYFLDVDTGSDLTWLQCDAPCVHCTEAPHPFYRPSNNLVDCKDPICESLQPPGQRCENPQQCDYEVDYADGGSSLGVLVRDSFLLNFTSGARITPVLALGCGYDQLASKPYHPIDGILGLGRGKSSIISQLSSQGFVRNIIGHCLSSRAGGFLFFGDEIYDSSRVTWTPMARDYPKHYSPGLAELIFAGKSTGLRGLFVVFDSGSSYTYLNSQAYQVLVSLIEKELSGKSLERALDDKTLPICWKGRKPFKSLREVKKYFKPLAMSFGDGGKARALFEFTAETYLILSSKGNVCLGILNGSEVGLEEFNVIGDISMQDRMVIYDNERQAIGWIPANCDRLPKSQSSRI